MAASAQDRSGEPARRKLNCGNKKAVPEGTAKFGGETSHSAELSSRTLSAAYRRGWFRFKTPVRSGAGPDYAVAATIESPTICTIRSKVASCVISGGANT